MHKEILPTLAYRCEYLKKYTEKNPGAETGIVGRSILSKDIDYFRIGDGKRHILAVGAHHAMEYITASALYDFIGFLTEKSARGDTYCGVNLGFLLKKFSFWVIPCVNPDGVEIQLSGIERSPLYERQIRMNGGSSDFSDWQSNSRGVDLNHNYNCGFFEYKKTIEEKEGIIPGKTRYSGEYPESEPETRSLAGFIRALSPSAVISLHTQGEEIYSMPKSDEVNRVAKRAACAIGYKTAVAEGHAAYSGLVDYTGCVLGIPSFTVELGRGKNPIPISCLPSICDRVRKLLVLLPTYL